MVMRTLCVGFVFTTITTQLGLLDKNIGTLGLTHISLRNHIPKMLYIFMTGSAYAP